jgi:hypothetical protein
LGGSGDPSGNFKRSLNVPAHSSRPSAIRKIYLDFDGQIVRNSAWNNQIYHNGYNTGPTITAPPFNIDGDPNTFSATELTRIREAWARVAEDFAPFDVDVTTVDPGVTTFTQGNRGIRVIISTDVDAVSGQQWFPPAGGVAYLNSWSWTSDTPVWVFFNRLGNNEKNIAEAASHEVGHALNLNHDGRTSPAEEYYRGHGSGATGWAPIMGVGYDRQLTQWSRGEYANANRTNEDDLAIIAARIPYIADDHGNTAAAATVLNVASNGAVSASGLITTRTDLDAFRFVTQTGNITLNFTPFEASTGKANLDMRVQLLDSNNSVVADVNPIDAINANIAVNVSKGFYTVIVDGTGRSATTGHAGYSDYGSLGQYTLVGTVIPNRAPVAALDTTGTGKNRPVLIDVLANDSDADSDVLTIQSVTTPSHGVVTIVDNKINYQPNAGFVGTDSFNYTISDGLNGTATTSVTVTVHPPVQVGNVQVGEGDQRSRVDQLEIFFTGPVIIDNGAFDVFQRNNPQGTVTVNHTTRLEQGNTIATLTFAGTLTNFGSLADGNYQLVVDSTKITDPYGSGLDGDEDGEAGGDFEFGTAAIDKFFRLFGDISGDRTVSLTEFNQKRTAFGSASGASNYRKEIDFEANGSIGLSDFNQFRARFGTTLSFS